MHYLIKNDSKIPGLLRQPSIAEEHFYIIFSNAQLECSDGKAIQQSILKYKGKCSTKRLNLQGNRAGDFDT
jgi:hypothetical protein